MRPSFIARQLTEICWGFALAGDVSEQLDGGGHGRWQRRDDEVVATAGNELFGERAIDAQDGGAAVRSRRLSGATERRASADDDARSISKQLADFALNRKRDVVRHFAGRDGACEQIFAHDVARDDARLQSLNERFERFDVNLASVKEAEHVSAA
jgi:hypothetical protein